MNEAIINLWNQGKNCWVISQRLGISESQVIDVVAEYQKK